MTMQVASADDYAALSARLLQAAELTTEGQALKPKALFAEIKEVFKRFTDIKVLIYSGTHSGEGVYGADLDKIQKMFSLLGLACEKIYQEGFFPTQWPERKTILFIPGAKATDLDTYLDKYVDDIKAFLKRGGMGLFLCGGAYWACQHTYYKLSDTNAIVKERRLNLFPGEGRGPLIFLEKQDPSEASFKHGAITLETQGVKTSAMISGGGYFAGEQAATQTFCVVSCYKGLPTEQEKATVLCRIGQGKALLTFVHLGYGKKDILIDIYKHHFPGHPWEEIREKLCHSKPQRYLTFALQILHLLTD